MVVKRKHEEMEAVEKVETAAHPPPASSSRKMQGQIDNKHSIDSDEEEDDRKEHEKFDKIHEDDIEGQEDDSELMMDGDIKVTPFNLKEERQEGEFSKDGNFVWNKKDEVNDAWLDNIDWVKIKQKSKEEAEKEEEEAEAEDEAQMAYNEINNYKQMLEMMQPGETVARTLRRLGGGKAGMSASQRLKMKKKGIQADPNEKENKEKMLRLTGLADGILTRSGNMEIYEETFESIMHKIKQEEEKKVGPKTAIPEGVDDDDALDMFADNADSKSKPKKSSFSTFKAPAPAGPSRPDASSSVLTDDVQWEFKWMEEDSEVHGPHSSQAMLDWQESGYFKDGCLVRKVGTEEFRDCKRIDFELYID